MNAQRRESQQLEQQSRRDGSFRDSTGGGAAPGGADGLARRRLMTPPPPGAAPVGSRCSLLPAGAGMPIGCCNHGVDGDLHPGLQAQSSSKSQLSRQSSGADANSGVELAGSGDAPAPYDI